MVRSPEWISVEERLPEEDRRYLVCCTEWTHGRATMRYRCLAHFRKDRAQFWDPVTWGSPLKTVTHWMPLLPFPPQPEFDIITDETMPEDTIVITDGKYKVVITNLETE